MKPRFKALALALFCAFSAALLAACQPVPVDFSKPMAELTVADLMKEFKDKVTSKKYTGMVVDLTGVVDHTGEDSAGRPYVALKGGGITGGVQCFFMKSDAPKVPKLAKGQAVKIRGMVLSRIIHVALDDCVFLKP